MLGTGLCLIILWSPRKYPAHRVAQKSVMPCWNDLNARSWTLHTTQEPVRCNAFRYTEDQQRKVTGFSSAGRALRCPKCCRPQPGWLHHQSAQPFQIHLSPMSNTIIRIITKCSWVLIVMPGTDFLLHMYCPSSSLFEAWTVTVFLLHKWKPRHREMKRLAHGHTVSNWRDWGWNPGRPLQRLHS